MSTVAASNCENEKKPKMYPTGIKTEMDIMVGNHSLEKIYLHTHTSHSTPPRISL